MMKTVSQILVFAALAAGSFVATAADVPPVKSAPTLAVKPAAAAQPAGPAGMPEKITRAEALKKAGDQFDAIDANHDGIVTREEIKTFQDKMRAQFSAQAPKQAAPASAPAASAKK